MRLYMANSWRGTDTHLVLRAREVRHAFSSFWYHAKTKSVVPLIREGAGDHVVDSGAHSFFAQSDDIKSARTAKRKDRSARDPEEYFERYLDWLREHRDDVDHFVELDIGEIVGQGVVLKWRDRIVEAGLAEKCLTVYHPGVESLDSFLGQAREWPSRFAGLEGVRQGQIPMNYLDVVRRMYDAGVKAHGFAMIKPRWITNIPFYSVDSSSFTSGPSYGRIFSRRLPRFVLGASSGTAKGFRTHQSKATDGYYDASRSAAVALASVRESRGAVTAADVLTLYKGAKGAGGTHEGRARLMLAAVRVFNDLEDQVTELWRSRGIEWE